MPKRDALTESSRRDCVTGPPDRSRPSQEPPSAAERRTDGVRDQREFARMKRALRKAERRAGDGTEIGGTGATILKFRGAPLARLVDKKRIGTEELRAADDIAIAFHAQAGALLFALLYLVEHVPAKFIRFAELIKAPLGGVAVGRVEARGHHYAQWRGPAKRWCIIGPTGTLVRDCILTKEEAERDVTTRNMPTSMAFVSHPRM
jgi:hypothetical protein